MSSKHHKQSHKSGSGHSKKVDSFNLTISIIINFGITVIEMIGGFLTGSLSLISDAANHLGDSILLLSSLSNIKRSKKQTSMQTAYDNRKTELQSALFNSFLLVSVSILILFESITRLSKVTVVDYKSMIFIGMFGLLGSLISAYMLSKEAKKNANVKSSYFNLIGDGLVSLSVIICGFLIQRFKIPILDTILSLAIAIYIMYRAYITIKESVDVLLQKTPKNVDISKIQNEILSIKEIRNVHHPHAWRLSDSKWHFECHIDLVEDLKISETFEIRERIKKIVKDKYHFTHVGIQVEYGESTSVVEPKYDYAEN